MGRCLIKLGGNRDGRTARPAAAVLKQPFREVMTPSFRMEKAITLRPTMSMAPPTVTALSVLPKLIAARVPTTSTGTVVKPTGKPEARR